MENVGWSEFLNVIRADIRRLDSVIRYNSIPVIQQESVATHSFWVTLYSVLIHKEIYEGDRSSQIEADVMKHALFHDIGECLTGDVVRTFKYSSKEFKNAVDLAEFNMIEKFMPKMIKMSLDEIHDRSNHPDGGYIKSVVKAADFVSLYMFMNREWIRGNKEISPFLERMVKDLRSMAIKSYESPELYDNKLSSLYFAMSEEARKEPEMREV